MRETFTGRVRSMSSEGLGVVEGPEGRVFFAPAVWVGDLASFEIIEEKKKYGRARLLELIEPSSARVKPPCPHSGWESGTCGGCPWQIVSYTAQLEAKQARLVHSLKRFQIDTAEEILKPIWASPREWGYPNRAQFKTDGTQIGFVSHSTSKIAPIEDCLVLNEANRSLLSQLKKLMPNDEWKPGRGFDWNFIDVDDDLARELGESFGAKDVTLNRRRPFKQANDEQNARMREWLKSKLSALDRSSYVLELFAGSGNFTEVIASLGFESVCAAEVVDAAMDKLRAKKLKNVITVEADLFRNASYRRIQAQFPRADVLVLDPPRDGLKEKVGLLKDFPMLKSVAYISCDLATFVRDLTDFVRAGFVLREIQPLDQFPHTPHIELMAWLERS